MIELINDLYIDIEKEQIHVDIKPYETYNYVLCRKINNTYIRAKAFLKIEDCINYAIDYAIKDRIKSKSTTLYNGVIKRQPITLTDAIKIAQEVNDEFKEIKELCKNL